MVVNARKPVKGEAAYAILESLHSAAASICSGAHQDALGTVGNALAMLDLPEAQALARSIEAGETISQPVS